MHLPLFSTDMKSIDIKQRLLEDQRYTRWHPSLFVYYAVQSYYG